MKTTIAGILFAASMLSAPTVLADSEIDPEDIIKYRQDYMGIIKNHNSNIKAIVGSKVAFDDHLEMHLRAMEKLFDRLDVLFPEGSDFGDTSAKDAVWTKPGEFSMAIKNAQQALADFSRVAWQGNKDDTAAAYKKFTKASCGGCHKKFRKKDD